MAINKHTHKSAQTVLDLETYNAFLNICKKNKRSVSAELALLIEKHIETYSKNNKSDT